MHRVFPSIPVVRVLATLTVGVLVTSCQEKVINIGAGSNSVPLENTGSNGSSAGVQQLTAELQTLKTELEKTKQDYASYRKLVSEELGKLAVGMQLGAVEIDGVLLKNVVVEKVEGNFLRVKHKEGSISVPVENLDARVRILFDPSFAVSNPKPQVDLADLSPSVNKSKVRITETFNSDCLVMIATSYGAGSGFIVETREGLYVYTNAHVICSESETEANRISSVRTASGKEIKVPDEIEISNVLNRRFFGLQDLARFKIPDEEGLVAYRFIESDESPRIGDKLVVYGDSDGHQTITRLDGKVLGVGGDMIEMSNIIPHGNSGGPVVSVATGKVVGVSTYGFPTPDIWKNTERVTSERYFALRPEKVQSWFRISPGGLSAMLDRIAGFKAGTRTLFAIEHFGVMPGGRGFILPSSMKGDYDLRLLITNPHPSDFSKKIAAQVIRVNERLSSYGSNLSKSTLRSIFVGFFDDLKNSSKADTAKFEKLVCPPYLQDNIPDMLKERRQAENSIAELMVEVEAVLK